MLAQAPAPVKIAKKCDISGSTLLLFMPYLLVQPFTACVKSRCFCYLRSHNKTPCKISLKVRNIKLWLAIFLAKFWVEFGTVARQLSPLRLLIVLLCEFSLPVPNENGPKDNHKDFPKYLKPQDTFGRFVKIFLDL